MSNEEQSRGLFSNIHGAVAHIPGINRVPVVGEYVAQGGHSSSSSSQDHSHSHSHSHSHAPPSGYDQQYQHQHQHHHDQHQHQHHHDQGHHHHHQQQYPPQQQQQQQQYAPQPQQQYAHHGGHSGRNIKLVLALDGGGIRGLATATFLARLEAEIRRPLSEVFDMFVGTSVGAIIAASIGCKRASMEDALKLYNTKNINAIFNESLKDKVLDVKQKSPKYSGKGKRAFLDEFFGDMTLQHAYKPTIIPTYDIEKRKCFLLRSTEPDPDTNKPILVAEACDGSSAAPAYFPCVQVNSHWVIDGGVVANNPAIVAFAEAVALWGPQTEVYMLTVGTGSQTRPFNGKKARDWGGLQWLANGLLDIAMDESVVEIQTARILGDRQVRINSNCDRVNDDLDDTSDSNIRALQNLGEYWWSQNGQKTIDLLRRAGKI